MKIQKIHILTTIFLTLILLACEDSGNKKNPLYGKVFRDLSEIPEFKNYTDLGGSICGVSHFKDDKDNILCISNEILKPDENGKVKYKIIDTINVGKLKGREHFTYCNCRQDTTWDSEIIALVVAEDEKEFYDKIVKAWRIDQNTMTFSLIKNTKGINCVNEGFGLDGCGGEYEDYDADQTQESSTTDTLEETSNKIGLDSTDKNE